MDWKCIERDGKREKSGMAPRCFVGAAGRMELSLTVKEQTSGGAAVTGSVGRSSVLELLM